MAKHRKHRRRSYRGLVSMPSFSGLTSAFKGSVDVKGLLVGVAAGLAGTLGVKYAMDKLAAKGTAVPAAAQKYVALLGGAAGGVIGYTLLKKKKAAMAKSLLVGAVGTGAALVGFDLVKSMKIGGVPVFAGYVSIPGLSGYDGVIADNAYQSGYAGMLMDNVGPSHLGALAASAMEGYGMGGEDMADLSAP